MRKRVKVGMNKRSATKLRKNSVNTVFSNTVSKKVNSLHLRQMLMEIKYELEKEGITSTGYFGYEMRKRLIERLALPKGKTERLKKIVNAQHLAFLTKEGPLTKENSLELLRQTLSSLLLLKNDALIKEKIDPIKDARHIKRLISAVTLMKETHFPFPSAVREKFVYILSRQLFVEVGLTNAMVLREVNERLKKIQIN